MTTEQRKAAPTVFAPAFLAVLEAAGPLALRLVGEVLYRRLGRQGVTR